MTKLDFRFEATTQGQNHLVELFGSFDENAQLPEKIQQDLQIVFDLSHVTRLSSSGAELWLRWVRENNLISKKIIIQKVPSCFVRVLNLIPELIPASWTIESFFVPYVGVANDATESVLFIRDKHFTTKELQLPPRVSSTVDGQKLELDVHPEKYFRFLLSRFPNFKINQFSL